jgi:hypothetical protein
MALVGVDAEAARFRAVELARRTVVRAHAHTTASRELLLPLSGLPARNAGVPHRQGG